MLIVVIELDVRPLGVTKISPSFSSFFPNGRLRGLGAYLAVGNHVLFTERKTYSLSGTRTQLLRRHNNPDGRVYLPIYEQRRIPRDASHEHKSLEQEIMISEQHIQLGAARRAGGGIEETLRLHTAD